MESKKETVLIGSFLALVFIFVVFLFFKTSLNFETQIFVSFLLGSVFVGGILLNRFEKSRKIKYVKIFFKGGAMGLADIIPGVSGGTIALITGIYDRLISAIASIDPSLLLDLFLGNLEAAKSKLRDIDISFLIPLVFGIGLAFYLASQIIVVALEKYSIITYSFFFGLILASAFFIYTRIGSKSPLPTFSASLAGFLLAFLVVEFYVIEEGELAVSNSYPVILLSGSVSICAMILPGISGALMLVLLGQYEFMVKSLLNFTSQWPYLLTFGAGAVIGLLTFSRAIRYSLKNYRYPTLGFLAGLMIGALRLTQIEIMSEPGALSDPFAVVSSLTAGSIGILLVYLTSREYDLSPESL